jgi:hypothetical protein
MFNNFYGFLAGQKLRQLNLFSYLETAETYGKIHDANDVLHPDGHLLIDSSTEPVFVSVKDEVETYVVFYQNLFFLFSVNKDMRDKIVQIYVKRPDDEWEIPRKPDGNFDFLNPSNVKVEVYVNYDVSVLKLNRRLSRCSGEDYTSGAWNKMFFKSLNSFLQTIEDYTEINQIRQAYHK